MCFCVEPWNKGHMTITEKYLHVFWKCTHNIEAGRVIFPVNVLPNWMHYIVFIFEIKYFY